MTAVVLSAVSLTFSLTITGLLVAAWMRVNPRRRPGPTQYRPELFEWLTPTPGGPDYTDLPGTEECLCGNNLFHVLASFAEGQVAYYVLEGACTACGALVALPYETQYLEAE